jgi:hypothetical protein
MNAVGISGGEQMELFQLVAGVLHMGNVDFNGSEDGESSSVRDRAPLATAANLLGGYQSCLMKVAEIADHWRKVRSSRAGLGSTAETSWLGSAEAA